MHKNNFDMLVYGPSNSIYMRATYADFCKKKGQIPKLFGFDVSDPQANYCNFVCINKLLEHIPLNLEVKYHHMW